MTLNRYDSSIRLLANGFSEEFAEREETGPLRAVRIPLNDSVAGGRHND